MGGRLEHQRGLHQRLQKCQAQRPWTETRIKIDVPCILQSHKLTSPRPSIRACGTHRAIRVIAAGHQHAAKGQGLVRHGGKVYQWCATFGVGWGHHQGPLNACHRFGRQVCASNAAQAVRHQHHGAVLGQHRLSNTAHPRTACGGNPIVLLHTHRPSDGLGPQTLPVAGTGVAPTGNNDDGGRCRHGRDCGWQCCKLKRLFIC